MLHSEPWYDFSGKTVLITGGAGSIGRELALAFAVRGASLAIADVSSADLAAVKSGIEANGATALVGEVDVRNAGQVEAFVQSVVFRYGGIDVLVNAAGVYDRGPSVAFSEDRYDRVVDINVKGAWLMSQAVGREMLKRGSGRIISYASNAAVHGIPEQVAYNVSKAGVMALTRTLAVEWAKSGITVNAVSPGPTESGLNASFFTDPSVREGFAARIPMGEMTPADATVGPVLFLASEAARWVTGHTLFSDGGMSAQ